jgi:hypothetical protein
MSVIFDSADFEDHEYMFANDMGIIDDLTLNEYLRLVSPQILASTHYELSGVESPRIPVPPSSIPLLDSGYISPDPANVRECTRQLELYSRVAIWKYKTWMHNHYTMETILDLVKYEPSNQDGLSAMCILNGVNHFGCAKVK